LPKTGGRQRGTRNRRSQEIEALLRPAVRPAKRLIVALLKDEKADMELRVKAAALALSYIYGRPTERREVSGPDGRPLVPPPRVFTPEAERRMTETLKDVLVQAKARSS
jgi:hypothetical protein